MNLTKTIEELCHERENVDQAIRLLERILKARDGVELPEPLSADRPRRGRPPGMKNRALEMGHTTPSAA